MFLMNSQIMRTMIGFNEKEESSLDAIKQEIDHRRPLLFDAFDFVQRKIELVLRDAFTEMINSPSRKKAKTVLDDTGYALFVLLFLLSSFLLALFLSPSLLLSHFLIIDFWISSPFVHFAVSNPLETTRPSPECLQVKRSAPPSREYSLVTILGIEIW